MDRETASQPPSVYKEVSNNLEFHACLYVQLVSIQCNENTVLILSVLGLSNIRSRLLFEFWLFKNLHLPWFALEGSEFFF